jgi:hypothetical protein
MLGTGRTSGGDALLTLDGRLLQDSPFDGLTEIDSVIQQRAVLLLLESS